MTKEKAGKAIPTGRLNRVWGLGSLAGRIAGNVVSQGAGKMLKGQRPKLSELVLTLGNIKRIADQLANMRGAAMKVGQLISMDNGDFLPRELADILARLRDDAEPMPKQQLVTVLNKEWGSEWQAELLYFSFAPVAAASIGQVHKAITQDGRTLAIKVQYPGIKSSIDSDVDNVASLIRLAGVMPATMDISPILQEAKLQLHQEADYQREAKMLAAYHAHLGESVHFLIPQVFEERSTDVVLAMDFLPGEDIQTLADAPQVVKDSLMSALMELFFREVFEFRLLQSDPNLANYRFHSQTNRIALLDFGATREICPNIANQYQRLLNAAAHQDKDLMREAALTIGLMNHTHTLEQQEKVIALGMAACESIQVSGPYDFGNSDLMQRLHEMGTSLTLESDFWHVPPADALFIHRKLGGLYMLAKRLGTRLNMRDIASPWLS
ncbi:AarF/ABC1/UbiB kinase family protein [Alteromonas pelagimontana]|uniref:AarF/ABC1/UbiB kinase family protein n=1 Tax=Alteromonas pelagimontana TaxID=1858656 RepID=A0A6M4MCM0_9ALTE|nr:AarF/ABC1/UbiB kinase family protein [Alteromonas pelagimontana]QJR80901.1 AarF/ABC1/UbiB kinase family protein [Alteromonas pelagimontana]